MDVLALLVEVDAAVAGWVEEPGGTVDRLHQFVARSWRPQDCGTLDSHSADLERRGLVVVDLLGDAPVVVALRLSCPSCGARFH